jgi:hypothetical protein
MVVDALIVGSAPRAVGFDYAAVCNKAADVVVELQKE